MVTSYASTTSPSGSSLLDVAWRLSCRHWYLMSTVPDTTLGGKWEHHCICWADDEREAPCSAANTEISSRGRELRAEDQHIFSGDTVSRKQFSYINQFSVISGKRVNLVTVTASWLEAEVWNNSFKLIIQLFEKTNLSSAVLVTVSNVAIKWNKLNTSDRRTRKRVIMVVSP